MQALLPELSPHTDMNLDAYYQIKHDPQQLPPTLRLRYQEWDVLLQLNDELTFLELGAQLGHSDDQLAGFLAKFLEKDLIERIDLTYDEYLARKQEDQGAEKKPPAKEIIHISVGEKKTGAAPIVPIPPLVAVDAAFAPLAVPNAGINTEEHTTKATKKMSLKALMDFIMQQAGGDSNAGQLMVYRVFMRVETKLLKRNGINSLRFQEDRLVSDPELENALMESVSQALGVDCPPEVFVY